MKKITLFIFLTVFTFAEVDFEKVFTKAFDIASDPEKILQFQDSAHALSDLWELNNVYTFDIFNEQEIEWKKDEQILNGSALLIEKSIFLVLQSATTNGEKTALVMDLVSFGVMNIKQPQRFRAIHPQNVVKNKIVFVSSDLAISYSFRIEGNTASHNFSGVLRPLNLGELKRYPLAIVANEKSDATTIKTVNSNKSPKSFSGRVLNGLTCIALDKNDGEVQLQAKMIVPVNDAQANMEAMSILKMNVFNTGK